MSPPQQNLRISVVMPVHNAMPHLDQAVRSIVEQTHSDFEFVIYDDASTDGSAELLDEWAGRDSRIRLFHSDRNVGLAANGNRVVQHSTGSLIARMDADDISMPERLERELALLRERPDVGLVGSLCEVIDPQGRMIRGPELWRLQRHSWFAPFPHGSTMFRRELFDAIGGYRAKCEFWEDLDFVLRMAERSRIMVVSRPLYRYRQSDTSTRMACDQRRVEAALDLRYRSITRIRQRRSYDDLLSAKAENSARVDPRVFIALGSLALWSNQRPRLVRRLFKRARLGFDVRSLAAIVWTAWASLSPATLRGVMHLLSRGRNALAKRRAPAAEAVEWLTPAKQLPAGSGE